METDPRAGGTEHRINAAVDTMETDPRAGGTEHRINTDQYELKCIYVN
jgi:hypothetical protein